MARRSRSKLTMRPARVPIVSPPHVWLEEDYYVTHNRQLWTKNSRHAQCEGRSIYCTKCLSDLGPTTKLSGIYICSCTYDTGEWMNWQITPLPDADAGTITPGEVGEKTGVLETLQDAEPITPVLRMKEAGIQTTDSIACDASDIIQPREEGGDVVLVDCSADSATTPCLEVALTKIVSPPEKRPRKESTMTEVDHLVNIVVDSTCGKKMKTRRMPWAHSKIKLVNCWFDAPLSTCVL